MQILCIYLFRSITDLENSFIDKNYAVGTASIIVCKFAFIQLRFYGYWLYMPLYIKIGHPRELFAANHLMWYSILLALYMFTVLAKFVYDFSQNRL